MGQSDIVTLCKNISFTVIFSQVVRDPLERLSWYGYQQALVESVCGVNAIRLKCIEHYTLLE